MSKHVRQDLDSDVEARHAIEQERDSLDDDIDAELHISLEKESSAFGRGGGASWEGMPGM